MFVFGHLGIGSKLVSPVASGLPRRAILLGTLLPDLIDKPLYYGLSLATGRSGAELGLISGSRTFGHTALFLLALSFGALASRSRWLAALSLGVASHLLLDNVGEVFIHPPGGNLVTLLWPFLGTAFPPYKFQSLGDHLSMFFHPFILGAEVVGLAILLWDEWKLRHRGELFLARQLQRHESHGRRRKR
jgi:hypothetical protein